MKERKKTDFKKIRRTCILLVCWLLVNLNVSAQNSKSVSGTVVDAAGEPVIGASIMAKGTSNGTATDVEGSFRLTVADNAVLVVSSVGLITQEVPVAGKSTLHIILKEDSRVLTEVVAIGYGTVKKADATGSVELLTAKDMNKGSIVTADNLMTGRMPGVLVIPNGNPGTGSQIRIRGGASLDASNDPLIVVDGLPLADVSISQINPNDIESFSVLKDASATAIYGSRASNGVILITTKRGGEGKWKFNLDAQGSVMTVPWTVDMLSQPDFINAVTNFRESSAEMLGYNGTMYNTDWQKEIFKSAVGTNVNLSALGKISSFLPARISVGYNDTPGLLTTSGYQRANTGIVLNPTFFNNTLKIDVNVNGSYEKYDKAEESAISDAIMFDPTKPVFVNGGRDENASYLGYYEWLDATGIPNNLSGRNPVERLKEVDHNSDVWKLWGNVQFDYAIPFVKGLNAVLNLGLQKEKWNENYFSNKTADHMFTYNGITEAIESEWHNKGNSTNKLLDFYLKYNNTFDFFTMDVTGGYSYQKFNKGTEHDSRDMIKHALVNTIELPLDKTYTPKVLISYFGRANLSFWDKYMLTLTLRNDHSSMFSKDHRSGVFPAASLAWRMSEEEFMKNQNVLSNLKLRLGWGVTGQQNLYGDERININRYLPLYGVGTSTASQYFYGDPNAYPIYPQAYNPDLKWEKTTTYNAGLDFGFAKNRIYGSLDLYYKKSKDLLANVMIPAGVNFANQIYMNDGAFSTKGIELGLNWDVIRNQRQGAFNWSLAYNVSMNKLKITDYSENSSNERTFISDGGGGVPLSIFQIGYAPYTYNVYRQVYDEKGNAMEGIFEDLNGDGTIDSKDRYFFRSPNPVAIMGFSTNLSYKNFDFAMAWRASIGNYIYNQTAANNSYRVKLDPSGSFLHNIYSDKYLISDDIKRMSDEWIENGSFLKWDNATLGYNFNQIIKGVDMRVYFSVQNILILTNANVKDPEVAAGSNNAVIDAIKPGVIDRLYPRPRTFLLGLNINF
ncbi:MAG: SusC/RagA family TonB-linked outer membrane protein [Candidatus Azobacteroides sp.]|nr:SusC/RagA family TonB-linked outer membrane protein [Candidatus Azobacteroides sp.]